LPVVDAIYQLSSKFVLDVKIQAAGDSKLNDRPDKVIHVAVQVVQGIANLHHACSAFFHSSYQFPPQRALSLQYGVTERAK